MSIQENRNSQNDTIERQQPMTPSLPLLLEIQTPSSLDPSRILLNHAQSHLPHRSSVAPSLPAHSRTFLTQTQSHLPYLCLIVPSSPVLSRTFLTYPLVVSSSLRQRFPHSTSVASSLPSRRCHLTTFAQPPSDQHSRYDLLLSCWKRWVARFVLSFSLGGG